MVRLRSRPRSSSTVLRLRSRRASVAVASGRASRIGARLRLRSQWRGYGRDGRASDRGYGRARDSRIRSRPYYGHCGAGYALDRLDGYGYALDIGHAPGRAVSHSKAPCYAIGTWVLGHGLERVLGRHSALQAVVRGYASLASTTGYGYGRASPSPSYALTT
jgi:hypothetical protein